MRLLIIIILLLFISLLFAGCTFRNLEETKLFEQSYLVENGTVVKIFNTNGNVRVAKSINESIIVQAEIKSRLGRLDLEKTKIEVTAGKEFIIRTITESNARTRVNYTIQLPKNASLAEIETTNGGIIVRDVSGDFSAKNANGRIEIYNVNGIVSALTSNAQILIKNTKSINIARSSNGKIEAEIFEIPHNGTTIITSNAILKCAILNVLNANIECRTTNGHISIKQLKLDIIESAENYLTARLGNGGEKILLETTNANVELSGLEIQQPES
ncbi:MAG: hypothetical protein QXT63_08795 [Thermoplasmata archaeon]